MPVSTVQVFESGHQDQIHDCQLDYYGRARTHPRMPSALRCRRRCPRGRGWPQRRQITPSKCLMSPATPALTSRTSRGTKGRCELSLYHVIFWDTFQRSLSVAFHWAALGVGEHSDASPSVPVALSEPASAHRACKVWQVSWAHPKFGHLLASGSFDRKAPPWTYNFPHAPFARRRQPSLLSLPKPS